jgi:hypothetical protein
MRRTLTTITAENNVTAATRMNRTCAVLTAASWPRCL